jgi:ABC-type multidrug transport system fused ATPase/permease subunit
VAVVSLFVVDPVLALVAVALIPTLVVVNQQFSRRMEGPASAGQEQLGVLGALAHESFDGALIVKTLGRERLEVERFATQAARLRDARIAVGRVRASFEPLFELLPAAASIAVVLAGAWRVSEGSMTTGQLVQAVTLFSVLTFPLRVLGFFLEQVPMAVVALDRVDGLLAEGTGLAAPSRPRTLPAVGPLSLAVEHLSQHHGQATVLDDVSFSLAPGEVVALVGATGSGKSTLCELLVRLADPDRGRILVGDVPVDEVDPAVLRRRVALVLQEPFLFADAVAANVLLDGAPEAAPGLSWPPHLGEALTRARADRFVAELPAGPDTRLGERGVTLSGGQRQRLALARALALRPGLLILDDATSAVDPLIEAEIFAGLRADPAGAAGAAATLLIVAHRLSTIRLADRVIFLDQGRLVASGRHEDLLALPVYAGLARAYERADDPPLDAASVRAP